MDKTPQYRAAAEECRTLAAKLKKAQERNHLLEMAASWERLAREVEAGRRTLP